jgi:acetyl-CoA acyltransferase
MAGLLAGLPTSPGTTENRLRFRMDAVGLAARSIKSGETALKERRRRESIRARLS